MHFNGPTEGAVAHFELFERICANGAEGAEIGVVHVPEQFDEAAGQPVAELLLRGQSARLAASESARSDDKRVDKDELKDIVAENIIELIVPITHAFIKKNGI